MSHAVNLRSRSRSSFSETSAKRRKISDAIHTRSNGVDVVTNGIPLTKKLTVAPTRNAKPQLNPRNDAVNVVSASAGQGTDLHMADAIPNHQPHNVLGDGNVDDNNRDGDSEEDDEPLDISATYSHDDAATAQRAAEEEKEPSFGDLLRVRNVDMVNVDVSNTQPGTTEKGLATNPSNRALTLPTATSLGTVLTQALRTNDVDLLESCLQVPSLESIRATVQRLHSSLATSLLQRLAERLHKKPGRAGSLMVWVQWTIVAHGGYLATQPAAMKQIQTLYSVVKQRAAGLQPLLALKGRLDMLEAQMQMRKSLQQTSRSGALGHEEHTAVVYVEGDEDDADEVENVDDIGDASRRLPEPMRIARNSSALEIPESDDEDDERAPIFANGTDISDGEDDIASDNSEDGGQDGLVDGEAEESENNSDDLSDEVDFDDMDDDGAEASSESEVEQRPVKRSTASQRDNGGRRQRM